MCFQLVWNKYDSPSPLVIYSFCSYDGCLLGFCPEALHPIGILHHPIMARFSFIMAKPSIFVPLI